MPLRVLSPGLFSLPVGVARPGRRSLGIPPGGPADVSAFMLGNALVGNAPLTPAIELTLLGPTLQADTDTGCVVFGSPFEITRDGESVEPNHTFTLRAGQVLKVGGTPSGCRAYLCVPGGFALPPVPTPLTAGDVLACAESRVRGRALSRSHARGEDSVALHTFPGPQHDWFPDDTFFTRTWTVGEASNRMGVRLLGEPIPKRAGELVSEPVAAGAVQVTHDGRPIILGVDGQTIGGYPKVAHVVRADLDLVGQLRPGAAVRFVPVTPDEAEALNRAKWDELGKWFGRLSAAGVAELRKC